MYKKVWCTCKVVVLLIKPIVFFFTFSSPSVSLDLKVPILAGKRDTRRHCTASFSGNELSNDRSFIILRSGEGLTSFKKNDTDNSGQKESRH